jgi:thioredoxin reductase (NADPH)
MQKQAEFFGAKIIQSEVNSIDKIGEKFIVHTKNIEYSSYCLLIATGAEHKKLGVTGETEFYGRGVSYCAVCDGPFFRNKDVVVIGGGDSAINEALYLSSIAKNVTVIHRRNKFRAAQSTVDRIKQKENVTLMYDSVVKEIVGSAVVTGVVTENVETKAISEVKTDAVFVFVGMSPKTGLVSTLNKDNSGYIVTDEKMQTNVPGLFCAGDVRSKPLRQIVTAVSDGAVAAHSVEEYIQTLNK